MNLFEINYAIENAFDPETGELLTDEIAALEMERDTKIRNIACYIKNLRSDAEALKAEKMKMAERQRAAENKAASLEQYLRSALYEGEKIKTAEFAISWRKSSTVEIDNVDELPDELCRISREPNKTMIKDALRFGDEVPGARMVDKLNMTIK